MKHLKKTAIFLLIFSCLLTLANVPVQAAPQPTVQVTLPFLIPSLAQILTFAIRLFFSIAAIVALLYLILGAFSWITSGGDKEGVKKAQEKIQAALIGLILIVGVLAIAVTLEQVVFREEVCFGLTCPVRIPSLLEPKSPGTYQTDTVEPVNPNSQNDPSANPNLNLPGTGAVGGVSDSNNRK